MLYRRYILPSLRKNNFCRQITLIYEKYSSALSQNYFEQPPGNAAPGEQHSSMDPYVPQPMNSLWSEIVHQINEDSKLSGKDVYS